MGRPQPARALPSSASGPPRVPRDPSPGPGRGPPPGSARASLLLVEPVKVHVVVGVPVKSYPLLLERLSPSGIHQEDPRHALSRDLLDPHVVLGPLGAVG